MELLDIWEKAYYDAPVNSLEKAKLAHAIEVLEKTYSFNELNGGRTPDEKSS